MGYRVYIKNKKTKKGQPGWWSDAKRMETITTYLSTGSFVLTEAMTGVPVETIRAWRRYPWWKETVEEIQNQETIQLDKKLAKVMDKALDNVMDRLENGEYLYDEKTGKVRRVPAKLRDTNKVLTDMIDKKQLIKKVNKPVDETKQITADHLVKLAEAFAKFTTGKEPKQKDVSTYENELQEKLNGMQDEINETT